MPKHIRFKKHLPMKESGLMNIRVYDSTLCAGLPSWLVCLFVWLSVSVRERESVFQGVVFVCASHIHS